MALTELLRRACPSIRSRIRREILGEPRHAPQVSALQVDIREDPAVQAILTLQHPDGWIANDFHGYGSMESAVRLLAEKDLDPADPLFFRALDALETAPPERLDRGVGKAGRLLDAAGLGGTLAMRAALLATVGREDSPHLLDQIPPALSAFASLLEGDAVSDYIENRRGKLVYRAGVAWPSIYHLRLLAFTHGWRSPANHRMVTEAIRRLVEWSPLPSAYHRHGSQLIAPASFAMQDFNPDLTALDDAQWMMWFHRTELLTRLGVVPHIPQLETHIMALRRRLEAGGGWFTAPLTHNYFRKWGAYTGLMLEPDWKQARRREYDLTFRSALILHYTGAGLWTSHC